MKTDLPVNEISKSQRRPLQKPIEPNTKIVQAHFGRQTSLKSCEIMWMFPRQTKRMKQFVVDCFNDLSQARQPATQGFGPSYSFTRLMRWSNQINLVLLAPPKLWVLVRKAFVGYIRSVSRQTTASQPGRGHVTNRKQGGCQMLVVGTRTSKAEASNDPLSRDAQQEMEAFVPAKPITPTDICLTCQPIQAAPLRIL
jgi:hypothetical protein